MCYHVNGAGYLFVIYSNRTQSHGETERKYIWSFSFWEVTIAHSRNGKIWSKIEIHKSNVFPLSVHSVVLYEKEHIWKQFTRAYQQLQVDWTETSAGCLYCLNSAEGKPNGTDWNCRAAASPNATSYQLWTESLFFYQYYNLKIHNIFIISWLVFTFAQSNLINQRALLMIRD